MPGVGEFTQELRFSGGLNTQIPPAEIRDNELVECTNFWYPGGRLTKRPGFFKYNKTALTVNNQAYLLGYSNQLGGLMVRSNGNPVTNLYRVDASAVTLVPNPGFLVPYWMQYVNGVTYVGTNSQIRTLTMAGFSAAIANTPPFSLVGAWHKGRLFSSVTTTPGRIAFSDPNAPGTWQTTSTIDIGVEDNREITALVSMGDLLLIFKQNSTWSLYVQGNSPADWTARRIANVGANPSPTNGSTCYYNGECFFVSRIGVYRTNGTSFVDISKKIWDSAGGETVPPSSIVAGQTRITKFLDNLIVINRNDDYIAAGLAGIISYVYSLETGVWSKWNLLGSGISDALGIPTGVADLGTYLLVASGSDVYIMSDSTLSNYDFYLANLNYNTYADGFAYQTAGVGSAYTSSFQTKDFTASVDRFLRLKWVGLEYTARGSPTFKVVRDGVQGIGQTPGYHATLRKGYKVGGGGRGHTFAVRCEHTLTSPFEFNRCDLHLTGKVPILASGAP